MDPIGLIPVSLEQYVFISSVHRDIMQLIIKMAEDLGTPELFSSSLFPERFSEIMAKNMATAFRNGYRGGEAYCIAVYNGKPCKHLTKGALLEKHGFSKQTEPGTDTGTK